MTNTIDITDYTDAELDALLGILPADEADVTPAIAEAYLTGVRHRDIVDLRNQVAAGDMTAEDAALWAKLQHGVTLDF